MSDPPQAPGDSRLLAEVRDALARAFAEAVSARVPQVLGLLEQQLALTQDQAQWKRLRGAIDLLKGLRADLAARLAKEVTNRFDAKLKPDDPVFGKTARFSRDSLSLVADDQIQEEIALGNASKRLKDAAGDELFALTQRLAVVMGRDTLPDDRNPAFPRILARALLETFATSGGDRTARIAAFAAFEPALLDVVGRVYESVNRLMRERGILPDFKRSYGAPVQAPTRASGPAANAAGAAGAAPNVSQPRGAAPDASLTALERLFQAAATRAASPAPRTGFSELVTIQVRPELIEALRTLEARLERASPPLEAPQPINESQAATESTAAVAFSSAAVHRAKREMRDVLTTADAVVADLVAALFDQLFRDARLTDATKAQIGRLQLPVFMTLMQDHTFFVKREHPIRSLIDAMAELGATDEAIRIEERSSTQWIAAVVEEVLEQHGKDPEVFARAQRRLAEVLEQYREAALEHDEEVRAIRDQEERLIAMREASLAIAHRLAERRSSEEGVAFLYRSWRDVMMFDFVAGGEEAASWKSDLEVVDDVLWMLTSHASNEDRARFVSLLPSLIYRLKTGFDRAGITPQAGAAHVEEFNRLFEAVLRAPPPTALGTRSTAAPRPLPADDTTATLHISSASLTEEGLMRGTWIEFVEDDGTRRRCRLNWLSPVQGTCVFKDLERNRSFAISLEELRDKRNSGAAVLVDGPGIAQASVEGAIADVARQLRES